jgi:hypothetical protein
VGEAIKGVAQSTYIGAQHHHVPYHKVTGKYRPHLDLGGLRSPGSESDKDEQGSDHRFHATRGSPSGYPFVHDLCVLP